MPANARHKCVGTGLSRFNVSVCLLHMPPPNAVKAPGCRRRLHFPAVSLGQFTAGRRMLGVQDLRQPLRRRQANDGVLNLPNCRL